MVVFDTTFLILLLDENISAPVDPETGMPVTRAKERTEFLVKTLDESKTPILVPTPALSELLAKAQQAAPEYLAILNRSRHFRIASFDQLAAVEAAEGFAGLPELARSLQISRHKLKFDRQIAAIAKVHGASAIYSNDSDFRALLAGTDIQLISVRDLPLPPEDPQFRLDLSPQNPVNDDE